MRPPGLIEHEHGHEAGVVVAKVMHKVEADVWRLVGHGTRERACPERAAPQGGADGTDEVREVPKASTKARDMRCGHGGAALQPKVLKAFLMEVPQARVGWWSCTAGSGLASRAPFGSRSVMTA